MMGQSASKAKKLELQRAAKKNKFSKKRISGGKKTSQK
uniref:Putative atp-dependent rna helicase ddx31 n=1 Tax=Tetraselmis sp. GSL018 TaxID=582737 RepID=A0A061RR21_9CHLO